MNRELPLNRRQLAVVGIIVVLLLASGAAIAATIEWELTDGATLAIEDDEGNVVGPEIYIDEEIAITSERPLRPADGVVDLGVVEFQSVDASTARIGGSDVSEDSVTVRQIETGAETFWIDAAHSQRVGLDGDISEATIGAIDLGESETEISVSGAGTLQVDGFDAAEPIRITDATGDDEIVQADGDGTISTSVDDSELSLTSVDGPTLSNPQPDGDAFEDAPVELEATVEHPDFDAGVTVDINWSVNGEQVDSQTVGENGTYSTTVEEQVVGGSNDWSVEVEDEFGQTDSSGTLTFSVPSELEIRDVHSNEILDEAEVTVEFFSGDVVVDRETTNGVVDMSRVPIGEDLLVSVSTDSHHDRTTIIPSVLEQQNIYLLEDSADVDDVAIRFELDDLTGQFGSQETRLQVQRPIDDGSETRWNTVAGDSFGAAGEVVTTLERNQRYRLIIENDEGITRTLGDYSASETGTAVLQTGEIEWTAETDTYRWRTEYVNQTDAADQIEFQYQDPQEDTDELRVVITDPDTGEELVNETVHGPIEEHTVVEDIGTVQTSDFGANSYRVEFEADRGGEQVSGQRMVSDDLALLDQPVDDEWMLILVAAILLFVGFIFGGALGAVGAVVVSSVATMLWWLGWFDIPGIVIAGALAIGALYVVGGQR